MFKINNKNTRTMLLTLLWCYYCQLWIYFTCFSRTTCTEAFCKKGVLRNFAKFTGKHLYQSIFSPATLIKKRLWYRCFLVNFAKFLSTPFLQNTSGGCFCFSSVFIFEFEQVNDSQEPDLLSLKKEKRKSVVNNLPNHRSKQLIFTLFNLHCNGQ